MCIRDRKRSLQGRCVGQYLRLAEGAGNGKAGGTVLRQDVYKRQIQRDVAEKVAYLISLRDEINMRIDMLDSHEEQILLRYRYLDGFSWEEIEHMMCVSKSTVHRIHGSALQNFPVPN